MFDSWVKEMATHSSLLAQKIPWTEELEGLQSMRSQRIDTTDHACAHTYTHSTSLEGL